MELIFLLLPLLAIGYAASGSGDEDDIPASPSTDSTITRDTDAASTLTGDAGPDFILGAGGNDVLSGDVGRDLLVGELGADSLNGGEGDDVVLGAWGNDLVNGNAGDDVLIGGSGDDALFGSLGDDFLAGSSGRDTLDGGDGNDELLGVDMTTAGATSAFNVAELSADLRVIYPAATDSDIQRVVTGALNASAGEASPDVLRGGNGNDTLVGDDGDQLTGGQGTDTFDALVTTGGRAVQIFDFDPLTETLALQVEGPPLGNITYRASSVFAGTDVLLDGVAVAYLDGISISSILPGSVTIQTFA
ncbi:MAG: calcium-binding protein [Paracoccaceae bacterium]